jgi:hypothetical protein
VLGKKLYREHAPATNVLGFCPLQSVNEKSGKDLKASFKRVTPTARNGLEVGIILFDAAAMRHLQGALLHGLKVKRHPDRQVRLQGRVEGDVQKLDRFLETHAGVIGAQQDRPAIFGFTDLEKGCLLARLDKIAFRIDHEQARLDAGDLASHDHRGAIVGLRFRDRSSSAS